MKRRDTEGSHKLGDEFFEKANIFDLQGLLINIEGEFSASIEAFELTESEVFSISSVFSEKELHAKMLLSEKLKIPFYIIAYVDKDSFFSIYNIVREQENVVIGSIEKYSFDKFIGWWRGLKGTPQTKTLHEAGLRIAKSKVDQILAKENLAWGGNVDGFIVSKDGKNILGVLEKRLSTKAPLNNYDPAHYFSSKHNRGGDYRTWHPLITLSNILSCPLFLLTLHKNNDSKFGLAVIDNIENDTLSYKSPPPCNNLFEDITKAKRWMYDYMPRI